MEKACLNWRNILFLAALVLLAIMAFVDIRAAIQSDFNFWREVLR